MDSCTLDLPVDDYDDPLEQFIDLNKKIDEGILLEWFKIKRDGQLNFDDFLELFQVFFFGKVDNFDSDIRKCFSYYDEDQDNLLNEAEFTGLCVEIFAPFLKPKTAFVIIDVQNDFINGSLALKNYSAEENGEEVVPIINDILQRHINNEYKFNLIVYTYDWHPDDHISFYENINCRRISHHCSITKKDVRLLDKVIIETDSGEETEQILWPKHCVKETEGAALHKDLLIIEDAFHLKKGVSSNVDSYSAFGLNHPKAKTDLNNELKKHEIDMVFVCGLASDICVAQTATDALTLGYRVAFIEDASRGVDKTRIRETQLMLSEKHAIIITAKMIPLIIAGKIRPVQMAIFLINKKTSRSINHP